MTFSDVFIREISEHADISFEEAKFVFAEIRHIFPAPEGFDRELTDKEASSLIKAYRRNPEFVRLIGRLTGLAARRPLPEA